MFIGMINYMYCYEVVIKDFDVSVFIFVFDDEVDVGFCFVVML